MSGCHQRAADRILVGCLKNGGLYVKLGQGLVSMNHILPKEYLTTLKVGRSAGAGVPRCDTAGISLLRVAGRMAHMLPQPSATGDGKYDGKYDGKCDGKYEIFNPKEEEEEETYWY